MKDWNYERDRIVGLSYLGSIGTFRSAYYQRVGAVRLELDFNVVRWGMNSAVKEIFWAALKKLRKLGSFAFVCFAIVIWLGVKACFAFFQDAIRHSLQEWLLSRNLGYQSLEATSNYRVVTKREEITASRPKKAAMSETSFNF
jgi:hypothetical protein